MNTLTRTEDNRPTPAGNGATEVTARSDAPALIPAVDVVEDATGITLYADMPGVPKERLQLRVEGDQLAIEGDIVLALAEGTQSTYAEIERPRYRRAFTLSKELDPAKVSAELAHGVLRVRIPKAEHAQPRRIEVQVG